jgi:amino acid adenylation domain-containing protein/non-ribosomal peptide synthase protein (TIGR01720 family)
MKPIKEDAHVVAGQHRKEEKYWLKRLSGEWVKISIPYDHPRDIGNNHRLDSLSFDFPEDIDIKLMKLSNESDARLFMILASALVVLLNKYTGYRDIIIGAPIYQQEIEDDFINTVLLLRNRLENHMTFKDLLLQMRETVIQADEHQNYPMEVLPPKLGFPAAEGENVFSLFDIAVLLENVHHRKYILSEHPNVIFSFSGTGGAVRLELFYNPLLYRKDTIERTAAHFVLLLHQGLADVNIKITRMEIITDEERQMLLYDFNDTAVEYPADKTIHQLFEEQVERAPNHIALVGVHETHKKHEKDYNRSYRSYLSYQELNRQSNRLAHLLRQEGLKPYTIAAMILEPFIEMVTAMLAVLKAGGAYLPIDPHFPRHRITAMLDDSGVSLILSSSTAAREHSFTALQGLNKKTIEPYFTPPRRQILDLDRLPFPDRSMVDYEKYNRHIGQVMVTDIISLQTARGCPYSCSFCSKVWHKKHVARSAEHIFDELQLYYDMGVRRFSIFDDIFNVLRKNSEKFFQLIIKKGLDLQLFFPNGLRGDLLSKDYIDLLVEAGLVCTALALETASPRLQKLINKNLNLEKFRENAEYFCTRYPQVVLELFTMHGFPTETEEEALMTLDFIKSLKWVHFPYVFILKIYPGTEMANLAAEHGVTREDILKSEDLAFHELSPASPFKKSFTTRYQSDFLNNYFLNKERLLHVLPYQAKVFTRDEIVSKYDSYLPADIIDWQDLLKLAGIGSEELSPGGFLENDHFKVPDLNRELSKRFPAQKPGETALRVLFLDLSQYFSHETEMLYDVTEPPLGGMYVMTYLKRQLGNQVQGKILKSRIDFDCYEDLQVLLTDFNPQVIGVRSLTFYRDFFHRTIALIRQWGFEVPIIAGGPYATRNAHTILQDKNIDIVVKFEGETGFCEIIEKIIENSGRLPGEDTLKKIPGIGFVPKHGENKAAGTFAREIILSDHSFGRPGVYSSHNPGQVNQSSDLAYVIYTSGSTGVPKGVVAQHSNAVNVLTWFGRNYHLQRDTHVVQLTNYTFDPSVEQIFAPLFRGASVYIPDRGIISDRDVFRRYIDRHRINIINFVPVILNELLASGEKLESLQAVISGGEKLEESVKNRLLEKGYTLYNQYGPTETTIDALAGQCSGKPVTLGKPIANTACYITGSDNNLLPPGVPGELSIAGAGVTRGYLNNPELTAEKFNLRRPGGAFFEKTAPPGPPRKNFSLEGSHKDHMQSCNHAAMQSCRHAAMRLLPLHSPHFPIYLTGDRARWLTNGDIEFLGRIDRQVKIRGHRIEPGEIENHLLAHELVQSVLVTDRRDKAGNTFLCAYYTVVPGNTGTEDISESRLREYLAGRLPAGMVPAYFILLDCMPMNASNKIDREALPEPVENKNEQCEAPGNDIEEKLVLIWTEVLGRGEKDLERSIGTNSNFFEMGGDSVKSIQIAAKLRKYGLRLESRDIFLNPTIKQLAKCVRPIDRIIPQGIVQGEVELTSIQKWFFETHADPSPGIRRPYQYNQAIILYREKGFSEKPLEAVLSKIVEHHDALRMIYKITGNHIIQVNRGLAGELFRLEVFFPEGHGREDMEKDIRQKAVKIQEEIDIEKGPLLKSGLFKTGQGDYLVIVLHHLVMDGISWVILLEDFEAAYSQAGGGEEIKLPEKTDSFKDWANALKAYAQSSRVLSQLAFWKSVMAKPVEKIPPRLETESPGDSMDMEETIEMDLNPEETGQLLTAVNQAYHTEINDILLTALGLAVNRWAGIDRVAINLEGHGREPIIRDMDISRTVGWFTSEFPVVLDMTHSHDLSYVIKHVKETLRAVPNKGTGYGILKYLTPMEKTGEVTFALKPGISFNYLGQFRQQQAGQEERDAAEIKILNMPKSIKPGLKDYCPVRIDGMVIDQRLKMAFAYSGGQYEKSTIQELANCFKSCLKTIIRHCTGKDQEELTPSDMDYSQMTIRQLDALEDKLANID